MAHGIKLPIVMVLAGAAMWVLADASEHSTDKPVVAHAEEKAVEKAVAKAVAKAVEKTVEKTPEHQAKGSVMEIWEYWTEALWRVHEKVIRFMEADQENIRLKTENAQLRLAVTQVEYQRAQKEALGKTRKFQKELIKATGDAAGITLATIEYRPPAQLTREQLYALALTYFAAHEDEKTAVIMTQLIGVEDDARYRNPKDYLISGISWYRVENFDMAYQYFSQILKFSAEEDKNVLRYHAQARLWLALCWERMQKHQKSQYLIRQLVDYHPHSTEAKWVNSKEVERVPSSEDQTHH